MKHLEKTKDSIMLILKGMAIGIGNAIPGVSGGTIAVVTKIFDRLIGAIVPDIKKLIKNLPFLLPVGIGMAAGIFLTALLLDHLFENYYVPTQLFFMGLIIGSVPTVYRECKKGGGRIRPINLIPFFIGAGAMIFLLFAGEGKTLFSEGNALSARDIILYFIMGIIGAAAMIIPGISGSMIMKIFGAYDTIISSVANFDIPVLICFGIGAIVGLFAAVKLIDIVLKKYRQGTYCLILGLIAGSLAHIYPDEFRFNTQGIIGIILLFVGMAVPYLTELPAKLKKEE